jgi:hypothetical protein
MYLRDEHLRFAFSGGRQPAARSVDDLALAAIGNAVALRSTLVGGHERAVVFPSTQRSQQIRLDVLECPWIATARDPCRRHYQQVGAKIG